MLPAGGVDYLQWVTHSVTHHCGFVDIRALATERRVVTPFNVFLGIVPSTTGVRHGNCQLDTGQQRAWGDVGRGVGER